MLDDNIHVLIVEDQPAHVELIRRAFVEANPKCRVTAARTLAEARQAMGQDPPDLLIADLCLPDGEGTEILDQDHMKPSIPVILMTSFGSEIVAVNAIKAGAMDYIVKTEDAFL